MAWPNGAEPQVQVRVARARLLQGRGRGASEAEIDALTRERPRYAGEPVSEQLEALHERTAVARGDVAAMQRDVDRTRDRLAASVEALVSRVDPRHLRPGSASIALALAVGLLLVARWRRHR